MFSFLKNTFRFKINPGILSVEESYDNDDDNDDDKEDDIDDLLEEKEIEIEFETGHTPPLDPSKDQAWTNFRDWLIGIIYQNPNLLNIIKTSISGLIDFIFGKDSPPSILTGALSSIFDIFKSSHFEGYYSLVSSKKGYVYLTHKSTNIAFLFIDVLEKYPHKTIKFIDGTSLINYKLPLGDVYLYTYAQANAKEFYLYYNKSKIERKLLLNFLSNEKIKLLNSKFILLSKETDNAYSVSAIQPSPKPSQLAADKLEHIKKFISAGMNRSILLYGPPGTGKSTLAITLLENLGYRTLVFNASYKVGATNIIDYIVDVFNIDAIIIDDFDQLEHSSSKLDLLEDLNRRCKVVIGVANSLKDFHPAILRPGRFDEVVLINELDRDCIIQTLGTGGEQLYEKVKKWPIAYIKELAKRAQFLSIEELEPHIEELERRVTKQLGKS